MRVIKTVLCKNFLRGRLFSLNGTQLPKQRTGLEVTVAREKFWKIGL
jgi:hypothetical protein